MEHSELKAIYGEIILGYSLLNLEGETIYVKHLCSHEQSPIDARYDSLYKEALNRKLPTEKTRLDFLNRTGEWGDKEETEMGNARKTVSRMEDTIKLLMLPSQIADYKQKLDVQNGVYHSLQNKKYKLIGTTAETSAQRRLNDLYLFYSLKSTEKCDELKYGEDEFDNLIELGLLKYKYSLIMSNLFTYNIRKLSLLPLIQNIIYLADNDIWKFYGKPVVYLSIFATQLWSYANFYKQVLAKNPPELIIKLNDPDKLEMWNKGSEQIKKTLEKYSSGGVGIMNATKEDMEFLGVANKDHMNISKMTAEKGGLRLQDVLGK